MAYAALTDVQARFPKAVWSGGPTSQPAELDVENWLTTVSDWVDSTLRWRYGVPVTNASDILVLSQVVALLVAAIVWDVIAAWSKDSAPGASPALALRKAAYQMLAYDERQGRSLLVLPNTTESDSGAAAGGIADSSFTDPDACGSVPRSFSTAMEF